jgi:hypothetical protein
MLIHQNGQPIGVVGMIVPFVDMGRTGGTFTDMASDIFIPLGLGFGQRKLNHGAAHEGGGKGVIVIEGFAKLSEL